MKNNNLQNLTVNWYRQFIIASVLLVQSGCAILIVPVVTTGQEIMRDRKGEFEKHRDEMIGVDVNVMCDYGYSIGRLDKCGHLVKTEVVETGHAYTFEIVPPGCSFAIDVDSGDIITSWKYVSDPKECWKYFAAPW